MPKQMTNFQYTFMNCKIIDIRVILTQNNMIKIKSCYIGIPLMLLFCTQKMIIYLSLLQAEMNDCLFCKTHDYFILRGRNKIMLEKGEYLLLHNVT